MLGAGVAVVRQGSSGIVEKRDGGEQEEEEAEEESHGQEGRKGGLHYSLLPVTRQCASQRLPTMAGTVPPLPL